MLLNLTSPHTKQSSSTQQVMLRVILATLPGLAMMTYLFGWGTFLNVIIAVTVAVCAEAATLKLRQRPIHFYLSDLSAVVTGLLLGLAIPPTAPWWLTLIGSGFAIVIVKQLYGGLGNNPFNPAMAGYVLLLISFPVEMTSWLPTDERLSFVEALQAIFTGQVGQQPIDAITMATALDTVKTFTRESGVIATLSHDQALNTLYDFTDASRVLHYSESFGLYADGWLLVNLAFLLGGLYLVQRRVIGWQIPLAMLTSLGLMAALFYYLLDASNGSPLFHLLSGGTLLGAFFIATDPVSAATSNRGRIIYGAAIGLLIYIIRTWGGYPDAIAFAVLLMNLAAPTLDYYTQPRTYGHNRANRGTAKTGG